MQDHALFSNWPLERLTPESFDAKVASHGDSWVVVFFWGRQCPNCEVAKNTMLEHLDEYRSFPFAWYHVNTYEDADLGIRFGLHGIPTFLFFKRGLLKARATSFPGHEEMLAILNRVRGT